MLFQIWHEFVLKIKLLLLLLASREARKKAALHCINATIRSLQKVPIMRSNIYDLSLITYWLRFMIKYVINVLVKIHDKVCNSRVTTSG